MSKTNGNGAGTGSTRNLNDHLFDSLERLTDADITGDHLDAEIRRAKAIAETAAQVIDQKRVMVDAWKAAAKHGIEGLAPPPGTVVKQIGAGSTRGR